MARGRRGDPPEVQAAKGFPGRRKSRVEKAIERQRHLAELLAAAPGDAGDALAPPSFLDERFAAALSVWRDYVPRLTKAHLFEPLDRFNFALFCVAVGEWVEANEDIAANGYASKVKTVSGDMMWRESPAVSRREAASRLMLELSKRFGLSPLDRANLFRINAENPFRGDLFGGGRSAAGGQEQPAAPVPPEDAIGMLAKMDGPPPGSRTN